MTLARDKALTKKILAYHGLKVPEFATFPKRRAAKRPESLAFPLFVKSLTEEGSVGISSASIVHDDTKLKERVEFIHRTTNSTALAEQFIEGREIYVGVMGNDRVMTLPAWEFAMTKKEDGAPLIASDRAKWDPKYQRQVGLKTGPAKLSKKMQAKLADISKEIYRLLGMSGYARLDYRVTEDGDPLRQPAGNDADDYPPQNTHDQLSTVAGSCKSNAGCALPFSRLTAVIYKTKRPSRGHQWSERPGCFGAPLLLLLSRRAFLTVKSVLGTPRLLRALWLRRLMTQTIAAMPKTGTIVLPGVKSVIACIIHEMSDTGAHLKVPAPLGLPLHFIFAACEQSPREASVVWWDIDAVGIHFNEK